MANIHVKLNDWNEGEILKSEKLSLEPTPEDLKMMLKLFIEKYQRETPDSEIVTVCLTMPNIEIKISTKQGRIEDDY